MPQAMLLAGDTLTAPAGAVDVEQAQSWACLILVLLAAKHLQDLHHQASPAAGPFHWRPCTLPSRQHLIFGPLVAKHLQGLQCQASPTAGPRSRPMTQPHRRPCTLL